MDLGSLTNICRNVIGGTDGGDNAANSVMSMIPQEYLDKLPPFLRTAAAMQIIDAIAGQAPELLDIINNGGKITGSDAEKIRSIAMNVLSSVSKQGQ